MVFDHNLATSGGALLIDGRFGDVESTRLHGGLSLSIKNSLAWANTASWCGGFLRLMNTYPLHANVVDTQFIDNYGVVGHVMNWGQYGNTADWSTVGPVPSCLDCHFTWRRVFVDGAGIADNIFRIAGNRAHRGIFFIMPYPGMDFTPGETAMNVKLDEFECHNTEAQNQPFLVNYNNWPNPAAGDWTTTLVNTKLVNSRLNPGDDFANTGSSATISSPILINAHDFFVVGSHFEDCGSASDEAFMEGGAIKV
jgi:hypothetical protein